MKLFFVALLITSLCACGTTPSEPSIKDKNNKWVGLTVDDLIIAYGEPSDSYPTEGGGRVFEYSVIKDTKTGAQIVLSPATVIQKPRSSMQLELPSDIQVQAIRDSMEHAANDLAKITNEQIKWRKRSERKNLDSEETKYCKIMFNISASDIIESLSVEGKGCN